MKDNSGAQVSKTFIKRFNKAASLARDGRYEQALEAFEKIHAPFDDYNEERIMTREFMGIVEMRKAYCLMDLKEYEKARNIFESKLILTALEQFTTAIRYDYYFSYANTLGILGDIKTMDKVMHQALAIALEGLDDLKKLETAWYWILYWAKKHKQWTYLEEQCIEAHKVGVRYKSIALQIRAGEFGCYAYRGLGKIDKAERGARIIIKRYRDARADDKVIKEWEDFLGSLDKKGGSA
jgi:tetratricopeptide (TPR) repeat protein